MRRGILLISGLLFHFFATLAYAQTATIVKQDGPLYVGVELSIRVTAEGFEQEPPPTCEPGPLPEGLSVRLADISSRVSQFVRMGRNGQLVKEVRREIHQDFRAMAAVAGEFHIPYFTVTQGNAKVKTGPVTLRIQNIELDEEMRVALVLPDHAIVPGQRTPVTVEWWYAGNVENISNLTIRPPMLAKLSYVNDPIVRSGAALPVATEKGVANLKATVEQRTLDGREFVVYSVQRTLVVDTPGDLELPPITANALKVTRWRRSFLTPEPAAAVRIRAEGKPQTLPVRSLPLETAPPSFAGAVGSSFTISVVADRSVVHVGDPIALSVTLRGDGNMDSAGFQMVGGPGGLDPAQFRLPQGDMAGTETPKGKLFSLEVRVLDELVSEIPPIEYSWFDSADGEFKSTYSDPIALRVLPTEMVTARDVLSSPVAIQSENGQVTDESELGVDSLGQSRAQRDRIDLTEADLAIETDVARMFRDESARYGGRLTRMGIYGGSVLLVVAFWWWRRVAQADPVLQERRKRLKEQVQRILAAAGQPQQKAATEIAAALRQIVSHANGEDRSEIDQLLQDCDAMTYAPTSAVPGPIDSHLHSRALNLARELARAHR